MWLCSVALGYKNGHSRPALALMKTCLSRSLGAQGFCHAASKCITCSGGPKAFG